MKKLLLISCLGIIMMNYGYAQNIPNGGFEDWEMRMLYEDPLSWSTANQAGFMQGALTVESTSDSYSGGLAIRLESAVADEDTIFGYAFSNGTVIGGELYDTIRFSGGFPVSSVPDSLFGYFKFELAADDTAFVMVSFKAGGNYVGQNVFALTGESTTYQKFGFEITAPSEAPDTAMVAFTSSNPYDTHIGGYLQADSLWFGNLPDVIPNADFEEWYAASYEEPVGWVSSNLFAQLFGGDMGASPTADANSGDLALRLEAVQTMVPTDLGLQNMVVGFVMDYDGTFNLSSKNPTFPIDFNPTSMTGYYKLDPPMNDTALIYVQFIDSEEGFYNFASWLLPASEYTFFEIPIDIPPEVDIVEASIIASTTLYFMAGGDEGTVLFLDDLHLVDPCETFAPYEIASVTQATCEVSTASIDAGEGWDEYLWSNDETTQVIEVDVTETATYSVTVTDTETGCQFSDEVELVVPTGCEDALDELSAQDISISLYPNPNKGIFTLEIKNSKPELYVSEVVDITGKVLIRRSCYITPVNNSIDFDMTAYPEGLYLLRVSGAGFSSTDRIMIK